MLEMKKHITIKPGKNKGSETISGQEGIYLIMGRDPKAPLYIGRSMNVLRRIDEHENIGGIIDKINASGDKVTEIRVMLCEGSEAIERSFIKSFQPKYNSTFTGQTKGDIRKEKHRIIRHKRYEKQKEWKKQMERGQ